MIYTPPIRVPNLPSVMRTHIDVTIRFIVRCTKHPMHERDAMLHNIQNVDQDGVHPDGGLFLCPGGQLHSVWGLKGAVRYLRWLGDLSLSDSGMPVWAVPAPARQVVKVSLAQFRDNFMVASSNKEHRRLTTSKLCYAHSVTWKPLVLCGDTCTGACRQSSIIAVGHPC